MTLIDELLFGSEKPRVFISHSGQDTTVILAIKQAFKGLKAYPYFVEDEFHGVPPREAIVNAVKASKAVFLFLTFKTMVQETRDWISFEMGVASAVRMKVFTWKMKGLMSDYLPAPVREVTTYHDFETTQEGIIKLIDQVREVAQKVQA